MKYKIKILEPTQMIPNSYKEEINDKIHPVDREKANAEIEQGEITFSPQTGILHKATGKKHSKGGTPVNLDEGSFIFSDFSKTSLNKKDIKQMEFKTGGTYKPKSNTPAKVLNREIDIKHHNHLINITQNPKKHDDITKISSEMMIAKNLEKIGQVAFKQEQKKQFPNGQPDFAKGTAPVYTPAMDVQIDQSEQFSSLSYKPTPTLEKYKNGGNYIPKYLYGATVKCPCGTQADGVTCITCPDDKVAQYIPKAKLVTTVPNNYQYIGQNNNRNVYYTGTEGSRINNGPKMSNAAWTAFINSPQGRASRGSRMTNGTEDFVYTEPAMVANTPSREIAPPAEIVDPKNPLGIATSSTGNPVGEFEPQTEGTVYNTKFTPYQKINAALPFVRAAMARTQYPMRQHQQSYIPKMDLINSQGMENQINQSYFNAAQQNRLNTNPAMAIAGNQDLAGNRMDKLNETIFNVLNQNTATTNNEKAQTAQILNTDAGQNRIYDKTYKTELDTALLNTADMKDFLNNQGLTNLNSMVEKKVAFDSVLNSQKQYRTDEVVNKAAVKKGAKPIYKTRALYEPVANFFGLNTAYTPNLNINFKNLPISAGNREDEDAQLYDILIEAAKNGATPAERSAAFNSLTRLRGAKMLRTPKQQ